MHTSGDTFILAADIHVCLVMGDFQTCLQIFKALHQIAPESFKCKKLF